MRRYLALPLLAAASLTAAVAQPASGDPSLYAGAAREPVRVSAMGLYQQVETGIGGSLSQWSTPVMAAVPIVPGVALGLRASYAGAQGDGRTSVSGPADVQLALSAIRPVGPASAVASLSVNLPSGERSFSLEEAQTAFLIGQGFYAFGLPSFGQGLGVTPGLTVALPVGERLAVGAGVAYQVRGAFQPRSSSPDEYNPADELLLTTGVDTRLSPTATLAFDATASLYGSDTYGALTYATGNALALTTRLDTQLGPHEARVVGRVAFRGDTEVPPSVAVGTSATVNRQGRVMGRVRFRLTPRLHLGTLAQVRTYAASEAFAPRTLVDLRLSPEVALGDGLSLVGRAGATLGSHSGFEAGAGVAWEL